MKQEGSSFCGRKPSTGVQAINAMAEFSRKHGSRDARQRQSFTKGNSVLVVYEYGPRICGVLKFENSKVMDFRGWYQPLRTIRQKLKASGWSLSAETEVRHATH